MIPPREPLLNTDRCIILITLYGIDRFERFSYHSKFSSEIWIWCEQIDPDMDYTSCSHGVSPVRDGIRLACIR